MSSRWSAIAFAVTASACAFAGCATSEGSASLDPPPPSAETFDTDGGGPARCSNDGHRLLDANGNTVLTCAGSEGCSPIEFRCKDACDVAAETKSSVGCEYYATQMSAYVDGPTCLAAYVANTWNVPAHFTVSYGATTIDVAKVTRLPRGTQRSIELEAFDPAQGIAPNDIAVVFLGGAGCPVPAAMPDLAGEVDFKGGLVGSAFRIRADVPVVAYQVNPYGGGASAVGGATLLLPTSTWDTTYVAINGYAPLRQPIFDGKEGTSLLAPTLSIVAKEPNTTVTIKPRPGLRIEGGNGLPAGTPGTPITFALNPGQHAQLRQHEELTGSTIESDKPIGVIAGHDCAFIPAGVPYCDHLEQTIPPVRALGHEYVGVMHGSRMGEPGVWRIVGAVDGTILSWSAEVGGPNTLAQGEIVEVVTSKPFVVASQDPEHPFVLLTYMAGGAWEMMSRRDGVGDAEIALVIAPEQYVETSTFFVDPTYPENNLVVIRKKNKGEFFDVELDCLGPISGWQRVGDYEYTRVAITRGFLPSAGCTAGVHNVKSEAPFGLWLWGWGSPDAVLFHDEESGRDVTTAFTSYSFLGGMKVRPINSVGLPIK